MTTDLTAPAAGSPEASSNGSEPPAKKYGRFSIRGWLLGITGGAAVYPLLILFGLNAVDQLDQTAFAVLLPNIKDYFGLSTQNILAVVALASVAGLLLSVPIGFASDRRKRLPIAIAGACAWGFFSLMTGFATSVWMLGIARAGSGLGAAVNLPTHNSLLADYYDIPNRPKVYSFHRAALAVGAFIGPLFAGLLAEEFNWRVPFIVYTIPTAILVLLALKLREPVRGHYEREAMGASA